MTTPDPNAENAQLREELGQLREELQRSRENQTIFWRAVTHELRTPMQALMGYAALVDPGTPFGKLQEYLTIIRQETDRLARVVDELHQQVELDSGQMNIRSAAIALADIVETAASDCEAWASDRAVLTNIAPEAPLVAADSVRVRHILDCLLRNAVRYSPDETPIHVSISIQPGGRFVLVSVKDKGSGIPDEFKAAIFERLVQVARGGGRARWGLGLGLYVSREIARRMGGDIQLIESGPQGSTFGLTLPIAAEAGTA